MMLEGYWDDAPENGSPECTGNRPGVMLTIEPTVTLDELTRRASTLMASVVSHPIRQNG